MHTAHCLQTKNVQQGVQCSILYTLYVIVIIMYNMCNSGPGKGPAPLTRGTPCDKFNSIIMF